MKNKKVFVKIIMVGMLSLLVFQGSSYIKNKNIRIVEKIGVDGIKIEKREYAKNGDIIRIVKYSVNEEIAEAAYNRNGEVEKVVKY